MKERGKGTMKHVKLHEKQGGLGGSGERSPFNALKALTVVFLLAASCAFAASPDDSARAFLWEQAGAQAAAATTPDAYLQAAATYNRLVADDVCNGPLFQSRWRVGHGERCHGCRL